MFVPDTRSRVAALLASGRSVPEIARLTGLADNTMRYHRKQLALATEPGAAGATGETAARTRAKEGPVPRAGIMRARVRTLLDDGVSRVDIARRLGLSKSTVSYHARRLGAEMNTSAGRRFDWRLIQAYYDDGHSIAECRAVFGFSASAWTDAVRRSAIARRPRAVPIEALLSAPRGRAHLKRRLLAAGLLPGRCERCGIDEWLGNPLSLQLHHVNGDGNDNRLANLQILCPNCHSQTGSWGGRNGKRGGAARPTVASAPRATPDATRLGVSDSQNPR